MNALRRPWSTITTGRSGREGENIQYLLKRGRRRDRGRAVRAQAAAGCLQSSGPPKTGTVVTPGERGSTSWWPPRRGRLPGATPSGRYRSWVECSSLARQALSSSARSPRAGARLPGVVGAQGGIDARPGRSSPPTARSRGRGDVRQLPRIVQHLLRHRGSTIAADGDYGEDRRRRCASSR